MKRPPKPTKYKHGDIHEETGRIFRSYIWQNNGWYEALYQSKTAIDAQTEIMLKNALQRAKEEQCPFDIDLEYLKSIRTSLCPVFGIVLSWGFLGVGNKKYLDSTPSLDKIKPEYGYVKGNVCIISMLANRIKQDASYDDLYKVADWLHDKAKEVEKNVKPEQLTSIPARPNRQRKDDSQLGFIFTTGTGEDSHDANDYRGAVQGENSYRSAKEGGGDSVGYRDAEMGTPQTLEGFENPWHAESTVSSVEEFFERVRSKSRELDLAAGTASKIRQFGD